MASGVMWRAIALNSALTRWHLSIYKRSTPISLGAYAKAAGKRWCGDARIAAMRALKPQPLSSLQRLAPRHYVRSNARAIDDYDELFDET